MKKRVYPFLFALLLAIQLTGCGGGGGDAGSSAGEASSSSQSTGYHMVLDESEASDVPAEADDGLSNSGSEVDGSVYDGSKLILRGSISAEATDFDLALSAIEQQVAKAGGYIENSTTRGSTGSRWAELTIRVPREQFDSTFNAVGENCHVTESARSSENVSADYYDSEARKAALEIKRDRLLALLEKAEQMEDIIALEDALSDVQYQIESLSGTLRNYDRLIAFSTLNVYLEEVRDLSVVPAENTFLDDLRNAAVNGTRGLVSFVQGILLMIVSAWWFFLLLVVLLPVLVRRIRKRRREREEYEQRMRSPFLRTPSAEAGEKKDGPAPPEGLK